jgi:hypothetical protein
MSDKLFSISFSSMLKIVRMYRVFMTIFPVCADGVIDIKILKNGALLTRVLNLPSSLEQRCGWQDHRYDQPPLFKR